jgi:hypothetical protein
MNTTDYNKQAQDFLERNGIKFRATLSDSKVAPWGDYGHHYRVTLSKRKGTGATRITFDFWGFIADAEKDVSAYDVLACISWRIRLRSEQRLRAFFTAQELEQLAEIQ